MLLGGLGCLCGGRGASGGLACGCSFGFGHGFVDEVGGEGGPEEEVEEVDEDEDEEEMVVFGDVGCSAMRAGAALWAAAASAAATAGRMEGMSSGCGWEEGGWGGPAVSWRPGRRSGRQWWAGEMRGCSLRLLGSAGLGSCNA